MSFRDVETMVRTFLLPEVTPVAVGSTVPANRPAKFVRAWVTGGSAINRVLERVQITITCYAPDGVTAADLATKCRDAFHNRYTTMPLVRGVEEVSRPYFDPDPGTGLPRYTFTILLMVRAARS